VPRWKAFGAPVCSTLHSSVLQGSDDPAKSGEAWMLKMSEWAPQSLGGSMAAGEVLDPKGDEGKSPQSMQAGDSQIVLAEC
jgi:hypothetical protein